MRAQKINIDLVIEIRVPDETIIDRLSGRRIHPNSGRIYHIKFSPPNIDGLDDETGETLIIRADDVKETIIKRLETYHRETEPLTEFYSVWASANLEYKPKFICIDGTKNPSDINNELLKNISK